MIKIVKDINKLSVPTIQCELKDANIIIQKLMLALKSHDGVGLAANQIGINKSVFITYVNKKFKSYVNPKIINHSDEISESYEGCLSIPNTRMYVKRFNEITISADNLSNEIVLSGLESFVFQHELDHLNGKTILTNGYEMK